MVEQDNIFRKIIRGEAEATKVYEDDEVLAFKDLFPATPHHVLIIPKININTLNDAKPEHAPILGKMLLTAAKIAKDLGVAEDGYRCVINCNADGGQTVYHLHLHLLAGRSLGWPPG